MMNPTCPIHGEPQCRVDGQTCTCLRITFVVSDGTTMTTADWNKQLQAIRNWKATFYGRWDGQKQPVPQAFQDAFSDGELEV